ncbi:MAG: DUF4129 domain-containing protein [Salinibacterium sp.]|nr:DUF4129 domain-containing protein [Salinibacterium sp.]
MSFSAEFLQQRIAEAKRLVYERVEYQEGLPKPTAFVEPEIARGWALLGWLGAFMVGLVLIWGLVRLIGLFLGSSGRGRKNMEVAKVIQPGLVIEIDWERIRSLVASGEFASAIHELLALTLAELERKGGVVLMPHLTSREIAREIPMPTAAPEALQGLVATAENVHFGRRPADEADFQRCRVLHDEFVARLAAGGKS